MAEEKSDRPTRTFNLPVPASWVSTIMLSVLSLGIGGAGGSVVSGTSAASELREFKVEVKGDLKQILDNQEVMARDAAMSRDERRALLERVHRLETDMATLQERLKGPR